MSGETGLLGLAVDPDFAQNHRIYTCQGGFTGRAAATTCASPPGGSTRPSARSTRIKTLVGGFPTSSGRHGGCRLLIARNGALLVGTGDAAHRHQPARTSRRSAARRCGSTGSPASRGRATRSATPPTATALHPHLRPPQRPGPGPARRRHAVVGRARAPTATTRSTCSRNGARLRLEPGARLQRVRPDDRPVAARASRCGRGGGPASRRWRPAAAAGLPRRAPGWGAYRGTLAVAALKAARVLFLRFDRPGTCGGCGCRRRAAPRSAGSAPSPPLAERRPAGHHRQRRRAGPGS